MYVLGANATKVDVLSLNAPGRAQNIQSLDLAAPSKKAGLTISKYLDSAEICNFLTAWFPDPDNLQGMTAFVKGA